MPMKQYANDWIENEDVKCRKLRTQNLEWLISKTPTKEYLIFHGGSIAKYLFEETRYCFVYAQYLAGIVLGFSFIEHTLASLFCASGKKELEISNITNILFKANEIGWLSDEEYQNLMKAKKIRNSVIHFRKPFGKEDIDFKAVIENKHQYEIIEEDAKYVLQVVLKLLDKNSI
jgi:hypothetical protein